MIDVPVDTSDIVAGCLIEYAPSDIRTFDPRLNEQFLQAVVTVADLPPVDFEDVAEGSHPSFSTDTNEEVLGPESSLCAVRETVRSPRLQALLI
jgi:hypothetical protein